MPRNPFACSRFETALIYHQNILLDPKPEAIGVTGTNVWQFCANGMYDPDVTGTGHQPMYYDNYSNIFARYRVKYSTISVTVVNTQTSIVGRDSYNYRLFVLRDSTSGITTEFAPDMGEVIEEGGPNIKWRYVGPSTTGRLPRLRHSCNPARLTGRPAGDDTLESDTGSNPSQSCYYYVGITSADGNTDPPSVYLSITIRFFCEFFDRILIQHQN